MKSPIASDGYPNGILVQVARGVTAVLVFAIVVLGRRRASAVYRVGLLAMIAGFMLMAFLFGTNLFWVSGAIIISGYTILDLLIWVAFSQIAYAQSRDPLKTIALMRLLAVLCYPEGCPAEKLYQSYCPKGFGSLDQQFEHICLFFFAFMGDAMICCIFFGRKFLYFGRSIDHA